MIKIDVVASTGFSGGQKIALQKVQVILDTVLTSVNFAEEVRKAKFTSTKDTNEQILANLLTDRTVKLRRYTTWKWWSKVVGYVTGKGAATIHCNAKYWDVSTALENADFIVHEFSHIVGYTHASASDYKSVPYTMNRIVQTVYKEILQSG